MRRFLLRTFFYKFEGIMLNILLFGGPGAGKGTQAARLIEKYKFNHISTGEVIRTEINQQSEIGKAVEERIKRGELIPDQMVIGMIRDYVAGHTTGFGNIFDGFPRTMVQVKELDEILDKHGMQVDVMLQLVVPDQLTIERLLERGKVSGRADDESIEIIENRISIYKSQTEVIADFYSQQGKYIAVDGVGSFDEVALRLFSEVEKLIL